ncbi:MAG: metallophosphoesterase [Chloroflexota bacterium]|nr:metallophosphoesterase [Chloroflexota bacterium]
MSNLPVVRFAVLTDPHIGATTANRWHNRFLTDEPEATLAATVDVVNDERPDFVLVTGDLSDTATEVELRLARVRLDRLDAPWIVSRGNHDQATAGDSDAFRRIFGDRAPVGLVEDDLLSLPDGVSLLSLDADWRTEGGQWRVFLPDAQVEQAVATLAERRPELLLIACHFPFLRQSDYIRFRAEDGRNAGTLWEGEQALARLTARAETTLVFAGHQHFHHITTGADWLHCTTASLAEYPAEFRIVETGPAGVHIRTVPGAPEIVAGAPVDVTWVHGRAEDREVSWRALSS